MWAQAGAAAERRVGRVRQSQLVQPCHWRPLSIITAIIIRLGLWHCLLRLRILTGTLKLQDWTMTDVCVGG